jgi:tetratricopeptide (TPR) repeat protein
MPMEAHFSNIKSLISSELAKATSSIRVAVAWFTDEELFTALLQKASTDVSVIVIVRNDLINFNTAALPWQKLLNQGGTLYLAPNSPALHHKFCLIDTDCLLSGSYNWTYHARRNRENVVLSRQPELARSFQQEFGLLLEQAQEVTEVALSLVEQPPAADRSVQQQAVEEDEARIAEQVASQQLGEYESLLLAADIAYCHKEYEAALVSIEQALQVQPTGVEAHQLLTGIYWRTKQFEQALLAAQQAEALGVRSAPLWNAFGLAFDGLSKYKEAITYYERSIHAEPIVTTWYYNKCQSLDRWGRESLGDKAALETIRVASEEIKRYRDGHDDQRLLRAYIERASLRASKPERHKDARMALEIFQRLPEDERDLHDLDDIQLALT